MNISEKISLDCGLPMANPEVDLFYYPILDEKFIVIDSRNKNSSDVYDHFKDVVDLIKSSLTKLDIKIYQFASDTCNKLNVDKCFISMHKKSEAYIISKSLLVVNNDNYSNYLASTLSVKSLTLYSSFTAKSKAPLWNKDLQIVMESHRKQNKPSYGLFNENPKTINLINPFEVAKNILDCLDIKNNLDKFELVHLGENFSNTIIEIVPDFISDANFLSNSQINLRLDFVEKLSAEVLEYWLHNRKANILTDKDINLNILSKYVNNIACITILLSDKITTEFLRNCIASKINVKLYCDDESKFNDYKFKFLDWHVEKDFSQEKLSNFENLNEKSRYFSAKRILSKGKTYSSKSAYLKDKPVDNEKNYVILDKEFEQELSYFKIYNDKQ